MQLFGILRLAVLFSSSLAGLVLNHHTVTTTALHETYNIPIGKKHKQVIVFSEHKLSAFSKSVEIDVVGCR